MVADDLHLTVINPPVVRREVEVLFGELLRELVISGSLLKSANTGTLAQEKLLAESACKRLFRPLATDGR